jgi:hypothetical protein
MQFKKNKDNPEIFVTFNNKSVNKKIKFEASPFMLGTGTNQYGTYS